MKSQTVLNTASLGGFMTLAFLLVGCISPPPPIHTAALKKDYAELDRQIAAGNINARERWWGDTVMHCARDSETIRRLLAAGADVNAPNNWGKTALHNAGDSETIKALLDAGANVNATDKNGNTPLHDAYRRQDMLSVGLLIARGADQTKLNKDNATPLEMWYPKLYEGERLPTNQVALLAINELNTSTNVLATYGKYKGVDVFGEVYELCYIGNPVTHQMVYDSKVGPRLLYGCQLRPDKYRLAVRYAAFAGNQMLSLQRPMVFEVQMGRGHRYVLKHLRIEDRVTMWIEDGTSGKQVGERIHVSL